MFVRLEGKEIRREGNWSVLSAQDKRQRNGEMKTFQMKKDKKHIFIHWTKSLFFPSHNAIFVLKYMFYQATCYILNSD